MALTSQSNPKPTAGKPFDAATKELVEMAPQDWLKFLGLPGDQCEMINADLATVTTEADRIVRVTAPREYLAHIELQSSFDPGFEARLLRYNNLADEKFDLPVQSVAILLRPEAARAGYLTGVRQRRDTQNHVYLYFEYQVVRLWEVPAQTILQGGTALLPLAPIADVSGLLLEDVVREMNERIQAEVSPQEARLLWSSAFILFGLRFDAARAQQVFKGVVGMRESSTYQFILQEGRAEGVAQGVAEGRAQGEQRMLLLAGKARLGEPSPSVVARVTAITSAERLESLMERLFTVESWDELLA